MLTREQFAFPAKRISALDVDLRTLAEPKPTLVTVWVTAFRINSAGRAHSAVSIGGGVRVLNCQITVKGNGVGGHGVPKHDRTGPLSEFLVDNGVFYRAVTNHLKTCNICTVTEVLQTYMARRHDPKFEGMTSTGLQKRAVLLGKLAAKKKETLPPGLVNEFLWRGGFYGVAEYNSLLSIGERFKAAQLEVTASRKRGRSDFGLVYMPRGRPGKGPCWSNLLPNEPPPKALKDVCPRSITLRGSHG
jgi:hypothetical protein